MTIQKSLFHLDVRLEDQTPLKIDVIDTITVGLDPRCDLVLPGKKIKNKHLVFKRKEENLALQYLGNTNQAFLNSLPLEEGKIYLLDAGDHLHLPEIEIYIAFDKVNVHETQTIKEVILNEATPPSISNLADSPLYAEKIRGESRSKKTKKETKKETKEKTKAPATPFTVLFSIKLYSLIADAFFTYVFLVILLPLISIHVYALPLFYYISSVVFPWTTHSFFKFLAVWYMLSFIQTMVMGMTLGQFLLGLQTVSENKFGKLIFFRIKTFFYSLFLLPAQNYVSEKLVFRGIRKVGMIIIFLFIIFSPFLLPPPFNSQVSKGLVNSSAKKELHTRSISSESREWEMNLSAELPMRYYLAPLLTDNVTQRGFQLFDLKTNESMKILEAKKISYDEIEEQLQYGNPFYSAIHPTSFKNLPLKKKKEILTNVLLTSQDNVKASIRFLGPFFGSSLLIKDFLIDDITGDSVLVKFYSPSSPLIFIGTSKADTFFLLTPEHITTFKVDSLNRGALVAVFDEEIMSKLTVLGESENSLILNKQKVGILEAQEAFFHGNEEGFLTYYVGAANSLNILADSNFRDQAKLALKSNIEAVMKYIKDRNVTKSFNNILEQLTPMEKPGEKR